MVYGFQSIKYQQIGYGFFDKGVITIYDHIHSYINIPDSCSRDSLFQSEARRCKNILDIIDNNSDKQHFCIFDELYSGTNPYEAIAAAYSYLNLLSDRKEAYFINLKFIDSLVGEIFDEIDKNRSYKNI